MAVKTFVIFGFFDVFHYDGSALLLLVRLQARDMVTNLYELINIVLLCLVVVGCVHSVKVCYDKLLMK